MRFAKMGKSKKKKSQSSMESLMESIPDPCPDPRPDRQAEMQVENRQFRNPKEMRESARRRGGRRRTPSAVRPPFSMPMHTFPSQANADECPMLPPPPR